MYNAGNFESVIGTFYSVWYDSWKLYEPSFIVAPGIFHKLVN